MLWAQQITVKAGMDAYDTWVIDHLSGDVDHMIENQLQHVATDQKAAVKDNVIEGLINMLCSKHSKHPTVIFME